MSPPRSARPGAGLPGRLGPMSTYRLDKLLSPRSVAVVGASPRATSPGQAVLRNLTSAGFAGPIHLVNPRYRRDRRHPRRQALAELPEAPDLVVIATPPPAVPGIVAAAGAKGCAAAIIITAGLGHGAGSLAEASERAARADGLRLVGPNCLGVLAPRARLNASFAARMPRAGDLALISQSGAIAAGLVEWAAHAASASRRWSRSATRSTSISATCSIISRSIAQRAPSCSTSKSINDARKFMSAARAAARVKPVVVVKSGRHAQGAKAAATHTGALAGVGCGLRRGVPAGRPAARARSRRAVRRRRDARAVAAVSRQSPRHPDQRRRASACSRSIGWPISAARSPAFRRRRWRGWTRRCRRSGRGPIRSTSPAMPTQRAMRRARGAARRSGERRGPGDERADRARLSGRRRAIGGRRRASAPRATLVRPKPVFAVWVGGSGAACEAFEAAGIPQLSRPKPMRSAASCISCATGRRSKP